MKKLLLLVAVIVVAWLGYSIAYPRQKAPLKTAPSQPTAQAPAGATVVYENNTFNPSILTVNVGTIVTFTNRGASNILIPSAPHPIHTSFPEFYSDTLAPGESYSFTFATPMTLKYHNHYNPDAKGQVVVQ